MGCWMCEAEDGGWKDPEPPVYTVSVDLADLSKKQLCVFHAPADEKRKALGSKEKYSPEEFNAQIFARIDRACARVMNGKKGAKCDLSRAVFPWAISFSRYGGDNPLPAISFRGATFSAEAVFEGATFSGEAVFERATFSAEAVFEGATFNGKADFRWAKVDKYGRVEMQGMQPGSLKHLTFTRTELEAPLFSFTNCVWPDRLGLELHGEGDTANLLECELLYRAMKKRATGEHDQYMVSVWHYREKLMSMYGQLLDLWPVQAIQYIQYLRTLTIAHRRKRSSRGILFIVLMRMLTALRALFSITFWYWLSSGFGERLGKAGVWLAVLAVLPFLAFGPVGAALLPKFQAATNATAAPGAFGQFFAATNATAAMTFLPFTKDIGGEGWLKVARGVWHVLLIVQTTLFALAVRNHFRR